MAFVEYLHSRPKAHFTRPELAKLLCEQTALTYSNSYLPLILPQMGLQHHYRPHPRSLNRPSQAKAALVERVRATFGGLQALGYDLNRVASGFATLPSDQLPANTARLWPLGKADQVVNTDKKRVNTFGFLAIQGLDYCQASASSCAESLIDIFPKIRAL